MVETGGDGPDDARRVAAGADARKESWSQTLEDTTEMAAQRRENGREAVVVPAGDTGVTTVDDGDGIQIVFVVPGNKADEVERLVEEHSLESFDVFRRTVDDRVYVVVEYFEPDGPSMFVAGAYRIGDAGNAVTAANDGATLSTHLRKLDKTPVATFEHADRTKFLPEDRFPVEN